MQVLFGVVGPQSQAAPVFDQLVALTRESNPGMTIEVDGAPGLMVGRHLRSWGRWDDPQGDLTVLLDGEVRLIDGVETLDRGTSTDELAAIGALSRRLGPGVWERLDGSYCLVIRDGRSIRIGFDVAGTRAVYWWAADGVVAFHTRLLDLAPTYPGDLRVDEAGVATYLTDALFPHDLTAFQGVRLVGAGQVLELEPVADGWRARTRSHFELTPAAERRSRPIEVLADELNDLLGAAMARSWRAAVRPVVPLSGGVDSRYLAAMAVEAAGDPAQVDTITWGEERDRPGSDGVIAPQVAAALGVRNRWMEKRQVHRRGTVERALYLTSCECDGVLNYPADHEAHERFAAEHGWQSLFRGDQMFGEAHQFLTRRAILPAASLTRIGLDRAYTRLLDVDLFLSLSESQDELYARMDASLTAERPQDRLYELEYRTGFRRELAPYNTLKDVHFEVHTPFLERRIMEWVRTVPNTYRSRKRLFRFALDRRFPALSSIPFATRSNVTDWETKARTDPALARSFRELCDEPGWLDTIGARGRVIEGLGALEASARPAPRAASASGPLGRAGRRRRLSAIVRDSARATLPGKLVREWTMERRALASRSMYQRLSRLVMVHLLVGRAQARHARHGGSGR